MVRHKKPTMNDVAKAAGVGRGTVSNYINGFSVQEKNKKKIEEAIKELGYIPNLQARALKTSKNLTVVFVVPTIWTPFFAEVIFKMQNELDRRGYRMILANSHSNPQEEEEILKMASLNQVSGVITMSYSDVYNVMNFSHNANLVSIERYVSDDVPLITSDNFGGGKLAAKKLIEQGCKRFLILRREDKHYNATDRRADGFIEIMRENHLPVDEFEATLSPSYRQEFFEYLSSHYKNEEIPFDGIFGLTDEYATIAKQVFLKLNPDLLKKVKIIGFDGSRISKNAPRIVDSIRQNVDEIVKSSVNVLMKMIEGQPVDKGYKKVIPVSYVKKENIFNL